METAGGKTERNPGLDLLRIVSMLAVVVLHLLGRGGVLQSAQVGTASYALAWAFETAAYCAVDCYALLSGYLLCRSRCRPGGLIALWLQVFCYSAGITALFALFRESVSPWRMVQAFLPVTFTQYWYFTAYFAVYCLAPFYNRLLAALSPAALGRLVWTLAALLSVLPTAFGADPFVTGEGYSFLWLSALYFFGARLRLCPPRSRPAAVWLGGWALCTAAGLAFRFVEEAAELAVTGSVGHGGWLLTYCSPLVLAAAVCLFQACRMARLAGRGVRAVIRFFAPVSFGVYLFHAQPFVFHRILGGALTGLPALPAAKFALAIPALALGVFLVGSAVDWVRIGVFRLLRIDALGRRLGAALERRLPEL
jgi:surface polysaccharide O-acyltransferase-like enzyme